MEVDYLRVLTEGSELNKGSARRVSILIFGIEFRPYQNIIKSRA